MPGSVNPYSGGMERMAHRSGRNMSRSVCSPVFKNPILLPSFCLALNQLSTDMVAKKKGTLSNTLGVCVCVLLFFFLSFAKGHIMLGGVA